VVFVAVGEEPTAQWRVDAGTALGGGGQQDAEARAGSGGALAPHIVFQQVLELIDDQERRVTAEAFDFAEAPYEALPIVVRNICRGNIFRVFKKIGEQTSGDARLARMADDGDGLAVRPQGRHQAAEQEGALAGAGRSPQPQDGDQQLQT
jgi:hypothetical protein